MTSQVRLHLSGPGTCRNQVHCESPPAALCTHLFFFFLHINLCISSISSNLIITKSSFSLSPSLSLYFCPSLSLSFHPLEIVFRGKRVSKMEPKDGFVVEGTTSMIHDAGPCKGFLIMHVTSSKVAMVNPLRIGRCDQKEAISGSEIGADNSPGLVAAAAGASL
ncbi:hypothetical protein V8G54_033965 [Vigna mungo]|uniref:Uncharacterized protein n=1 Tax=Vigna mungo TaxID=3915 RepID=A0AAQ3MPC6_VIGMU